MPAARDRAMTNTSENRFIRSCYYKFTAGCAADTALKDLAPPPLLCPAWDHQRSALPDIPLPQHPVAPEGQESCPDKCGSRPACADRALIPPPAENTFVPLPCPWRE